MHHSSQAASSGLGPLTEYYIQRIQSPVCCEGASVRGVAGAQYGRWGVSGDAQTRNRAVKVVVGVRRLKLLRQQVKRRIGVDA